MTRITYNSNETRELGRKIASQMEGGEVICLYGELGSGKTTFTQGFIDYFLPNKRVISPTFIIVRHYSLKKNNINNIYHVDLYRLNKRTEITDVGLFDFINKNNNLVIIEWSERLEGFQPGKRIEIRMNTVDELTRKINIIKYD